MKIIKRFLFLLVLSTIMSCSGGSDNRVLEGYAFSYSYNTLYITLDKNIFSYEVLEDSQKKGTYNLKRLDKYKKIWEFKQGSTLIRIVRFSYDYKNKDDDHLIVVFIKDNNFPDGTYAIGMLEKLKERPVPMVVNWADSVYYGISLTSGNEKSDYREFVIRNFATRWLDKTAQLVEEIFEPTIEGRLEHKEGNPYTYEYKFDGFYEDTHFKLAEILADKNTYIARIYRNDTIDTVNDVEIGIRKKTIHFSQFPEGQKVWMLCSNGLWAEGVIDDFNPEPLEDIDRPKIDFTFSNGKKLTRYATFSQNLCETLLKGSYACDFMYAYILDPVGQLIVLNDINLPDEEEHIDCVGGW